MEQPLKRIKAPNGKNSNLTERQRLVVRSAIFNRLFGDWRQEDWEQTESDENKQEVAVSKKLEPCRECGSMPELSVDRETCTISLKCPKCHNGVQACIAGSWNAMQKVKVISSE